MTETNKNETCFKCAEPWSKHRPTDGCPYNGWSNYETWAVNLWYANDPFTHARITVLAQECWDGSTAGELYPRQIREQAAAHELSERLKDEVEDMAEEWMPDQVSMFSDLLNAALSEVDWHEIAESWLADVEKDTEPVS